MQLWENLCITIMPRDDLESYTMLNVKKFLWQGYTTVIPLIFPEFGVEIKITLSILKVLRKMILYDYFILSHFKKSPYKIM